MRTIIVLASTLALIACGKQSGGHPATAAPAASTGQSPFASSQPPARKAGLWEQTMTRDGVAPGLMGKVRMCVDAASQTTLSLFGGRMGKGSCPQRSVSRGLDGGYSFAATCDMGQAGVTTSKGTLTGDLSTAYRIHAESDISGSSLASMNGHHITDIAATWLGPCPADMIPGDVVMGNGMKINTNKIGAAAAAVSGGG